MDERSKRQGDVCPGLGRRLSPSRREHDAAIRAHGQALLAHARKLTRGHADAWDLVQDTFVRAMTRRPEDLSDAKVRAWLMAVLVNLHIDRCRSVRRRRRITLEEDLLLALPDSDPALEPAWLSIDAVSVQACLARLDPRLRAAYTLQVEEGLTLAAAAARLGVPAATVGTRVYRARHRLRSLLTSSLLQ
jgi:RNA polymerase sigma-70 factor, ECF subfamily